MRYCHSRSSKLVPIEVLCDFLLAFRCNYRDRTIYWSKIRVFCRFTHPSLIRSPRSGVRLGPTVSPWATHRWKPHDPKVISFNALLARARQIAGRTRHAAYGYVALKHSWARKNTCIRQLFVDLWRMVTINFMRQSGTSWPLPSIHFYRASAQQCWRWRAILI